MKNAGALPAIIEMLGLSGIAVTQDMKDLWWEKTNGGTKPFTNEGDSKIKAARKEYMKKKMENKQARTKRVAAECKSNYGRVKDVDKFLTKFHAEVDEMCAQFYHIVMSRNFVCTTFDRCSEILSAICELQDHMTNTSLTLIDSFEKIRRGE